MFGMREDLQMGEAGQLLSESAVPVFYQSSSTDEAVLSVPKYIAIGK